MNTYKLLSIFFLSSLFLMACGGDNETPAELPEAFWNVQLNGEDFDVISNTAYYSAFGGDLTLVGTKSNSTEERIVFTFNVDDGAPFTAGGKLEMGAGSGNAILYFDSQGNEYSSLDLEGTGEFVVDKYVEGEFRNFLSGSSTGTLYNEQDSTFVAVTGSAGSKTF